jgi:hypothetical protein
MSPNTPSDGGGGGIKKLRQLSSSSSFSAITSDEDETEDDRPQWYLKDTSVQFHRTPAEQDPAVGFFCKFILTPSFSGNLLLSWVGVMG